MFKLYPRTYMSRKATSHASAAPQVAHSEEEWRSLLTPAQYVTLRQASTEQPTSSPLYTVGSRRCRCFLCRISCSISQYSAEATLLFVHSRDQRHDQHPNDIASRRSLVARRPLHTANPCMGPGRIAGPAAGLGACRAALLSSHTCCRCLSTVLQVPSTWSMIGSGRHCKRTMCTASLLCICAGVPRRHLQVCRLRLAALQLRDKV